MRPYQLPFKGTECPQSMSSLRQTPGLEFRPESADAFGACARVQAKTSAEELVLLFTFEAEAKSIFVELAKFLGILHPFSNAFGNGVSLTTMNADAVKARNCVPPNVPLRVKGPIGGDVNHRAVGCEVDGEF